MKQTITAEEWAAESRKGKVCGILGCLNEPTTGCLHCHNMYCDLHKFVIVTAAHPMKVKMRELPEEIEGSLLNSSGVFE